MLLPAPSSLARHHAVGIMAICTLILTQPILITTPKLSISCAIVVVPNGHWKPLPSISMALTVVLLSVSSVDPKLNVCIGELSIRLSQR